MQCEILKDLASYEAYYMHTVRAKPIGLVFWDCTGGGPSWGAYVPILSIKLTKPEPQSFTCMPPIRSAIVRESHVTFTFYITFSFTFYITDYVCISHDVLRVYFIFHITCTLHITYHTHTSYYILHVPFILHLTCTHHIIYHTYISVSSDRGGSVTYTLGSLVQVYIL